MNSMQDTLTAKNLQDAFAMEAEKSLIYHYFATNVRRDKLVQVCEVFNEASNHELEHAKLWYKLLHDGVPGTQQNLASALALEDDSTAVRYTQYAHDARQEGFQELAEKFELAVAADAARRAKLAKLLQNLQDGSVFARSGAQDWLCSTCGYVYQGESAPEVCPLCDHGRAYYRISPTNY